MPPLIIIIPPDPVSIFVLVLFALPTGLHLLLDRWSSARCC